MGLNDIDYMDSEIGRVELSAQFKLKQIHDITNSLLDNKNSNNKPMKSDFTIGYMVAIIMLLIIYQITKINIWIERKKSPN
ncbi:hypothetical protein N42HA_01390 [Lactococcus lactis]|nr:hypothetical protein [Lactococcus lactis]